MSIELTNETRQTFGGRVLKQGQHVKARMSLNSTDENGEDWREEERECEAYVSRIENDRPLFIAINPYENRTLAIRQMQMPFVRSEDELQLWTWTWLWVTLSELRNGAIFETEKGIRAVKSEYRTDSRVDCYLLASGEYAYFAIDPNEHNATLVREIKIPN